MRSLPAIPSANLRQSGKVPPDDEKVVGRPTGRGNGSGVAAPAGPLRGLLQHRPTPPGTRQSTPAQAYAARPKAIPTGVKIPAHYRVRNDTIDTGGTVTLRHNSRLHHIGVGAARRGTRVTLLIDDLHIRIIGRDTAELIRELNLDPTRDYQPRGLPPGPPKKTTRNATMSQDTC